MNDISLNNIKYQFPIFDNQPNLVYLDSAASTMTPQCVVDTITAYYTQCSANVARGIYDLSTQATTSYKSARADIAQFIGADTDEIVFTSGTTMSLNMIANGLTHTLTSGNTIVITQSEHHSNFVPWQQIFLRSNINNTDLRVLPILPNGSLDLDNLAQIIDNTTSILALPYISNVLGIVNPIKAIIARAKSLNPNIITVVDAAQAIAHIPIDVKDLDCDFLSFSGHKMYGPTGIGVLYGKKEKLSQLTPLLYGGEMVEQVATNKSTFKDIPHRLEAGTPNIAGAIGLAAAMRFIESIGYDKIATHEQQLLIYALTQLRKNFGNHVIFYGFDNSNKPNVVSIAQNHIGLISFTLVGIHPHDVAEILNTDHIAIRAGMHCAQPLHAKLNIGATARISFGIYSTTEDIDKLIISLQTAQKVFEKK